MGSEIVKELLIGAVAAAIFAAVIIGLSPPELEYAGGIPDWADEYAERLDEYGGHVVQRDRTFTIHVSVETDVTVTDEGFLFTNEDTQLLLEYWRIAYIFINDIS